MSALTKKIARASSKEGMTSLCSCGEMVVLPEGDRTRYFTSCSENIAFGMKISISWMKQSRTEDPV
jgi:hypothetical protein